MKTITVTGATSMIGLALIKQCIARGIKVYAFVRPHSSKTGRLPHSNLVDVLEYGLDEIQNCNEKIEADVFYHLGWAHTDKSGRNDCKKQEANILWTLNAIEAAKQFNCKKFVGAGSQAEYGPVNTALNGSVPVNPETPYGIAKYAAGKLAKLQCNTYNIGFNWVRILSVYGANDSDATLVKSFIKNCANNTSMPLSPCTHTWDYLHEDDAGRALLAIGERGVDGKTYCLGSGEGRPLFEYLEIIKNMINKTYTPEYGSLHWTAGVPLFLKADIAELTHDTGWRPAISFEEGIKLMIDCPPPPPCYRTRRNKCCYIVFIYRPSSRRGGLK